MIKLHTITILLTLFSALANAQSGPNPVVPLAASIQAGQPTTVHWAPNTGGTVSLQLRWGNPGYLNQGIAIASGIPNTGAYAWTPDPNLKAGTDYTIEIISDQNKEETNFSPAFGIVSNGKGVDGGPTAPFSSPAPTTTTTTTSTENMGKTESLAASLSHEASKISDAVASMTSSKARAKTNAAAHVEGGVGVVAGLGAVIFGFA